MMNQERPDIACPVTAAVGGFTVVVIPPSPGKAVKLSKHERAATAGVKQRPRPQGRADMGQAEQSSAAQSRAEQSSTGLHKPQCGAPLEYISYYLDGAGKV